MSFAAPIGAAARPRPLLLSRYCVLVLLPIPFSGCDRRDPPPSATSSSSAPAEKARPPAPGDRAAAQPRFDAAAAAMAKRDEAIAFAEVERALALDPAFAQARALRAMIRARPGPRFDPGAAASDFEIARALGADPDALAGFEGLVRYQLGDPAAKAMLERAWNLPPAAQGNERPDVALALGHLALREEKRDDAQRYFEEARKLSPKHPLPCEALAELAAARGDLAGQERWLDQAIALNPRSVGARNARVQLYAKTKRTAQFELERTIHELLRVLQDDDTGSEGRDHRRRAEAWERYAELVPEDAGAPLEAVKSRTLAGDFAGARALAQRCASRSGADAAAWDGVLRELDRLEQQAGGAPPKERS
jgi:Tfp pilus assembly protein PilF